MGSTGAVLDGNLPEREGAGFMSGALHLAQALSNRGWRGTQEGFPRCRTSGEAVGGSGARLSFVPDIEQRLWRTVMRRKYQLTRRSRTVTEPIGEFAGRGSS